MSADLLPPPNLLGAPDKFDSWRPDQAEALLCALDSPKQFVGLVLPTGSGKTLVGTMLHVLSGKRTAILTSTKALQDQIGRDFGSLGIVDAKGQSAYECLAVRPGGSLHGAIDFPATCDRGPCHAKVACSLKDGGCLYYDSVKRARSAPLLSTNYAYWLTQNSRPPGLGAFDILVLDESHAAPDELAGFLSTELKFNDIRNLLGGAIPNVPKGADMVTTVATWRAWAAQWARTITGQLGNEDEQIYDVAVTPKSAREIGRHIKLLGMSRTLQRIGTMIPTDWLLHEETDRVVFDPVWVAGYKDLLFRNIPKIVFMSATFRPKTADLLGLDRADIDFYEARSGFDPKHRPVYVLRNAPRVDFRMDDEGFSQWAGLINNILDARPDRKGIIHTVSYKRRNDLVRMSRHRDRMMSHSPDNTRQVIEEFKASPPGTVLVSPSVTTGYDFPYTECEFQIITKMPFPDSRDPILKARTAEDRDYGAYLMMQELVQSVGRGMRAPDDRCETFIVDGHALWALNKYRDLAPSWFHEAIRKIDVLPPPLDKLEDKQED